MWRQCFAGARRARFAAAAIAAPTLAAPTFVPHTYQQDQGENREWKLPNRGCLKCESDNKSKFKRILVTGGAGFLGSHLCRRLLADGHEVMCLDN